MTLSVSERYKQLFGPTVDAQIIDIQYCGDSEFLLTLCNGVQVRRYLDITEYSNDKVYTQEEWFGEDF